MVDNVLLVLMFFAVPAIAVCLLYLACRLLKSFFSKEDFGQEEILSSEKTLFVLQYRPWRIAWRLVFPFSFAIPIAYMMVFHWAFTRTGFKFWLLELAGSLMLFALLFQFVDMLLFKEMKLYKDKIVKSWYFLGRREIRLHDARMGGMNNLIMRVKKIYDRETNVFLAPIKGIFYDETLANSEDIKKLNQELAGLSGREVEEFEQYRVSFKRLTKEAGSGKL